MSAMLAVGKSNVAARAIGRSTGEQPNSRAARPRVIFLFMAGGARSVVQVGSVLEALARQRRRRLGRLAALAGLFIAIRHLQELEVAKRDRYKLQPDRQV